MDKDLKSLKVADQTVAADSECQQMNSFTEGPKVSLSSRRVQGIPDKDQKMFLAGSSMVLQQVDHIGCPSRTKSNDGKFSEIGNAEMDTKSNDAKFTESGNVEKEIGDNLSLSNKKLADGDNHISNTSSFMVNHDLENHQECDSCDKVTSTCKADAVMVNAENDYAATSLQNSGSTYISSKFVEFWVPVQISNVQLEQYCATLLSKAMNLQSCSKDTLGALSDVFVSNQKCCNHPFLVDPDIENLITKDLEPSMMFDASIKASGKLCFLDHILPEVRKRQQRVLVLFQPTRGPLNKKVSIGSILEDYVVRRFGQESYEIVDGSTSSKKQAASNKFNREMSRFIFLLESRACSQSIKLSSVDIIIIFDSDLIPATDLRALQKVNIDSQSEPIMIFRLYSSSTLEEKILKLAEQNVAIDIRSQTLRSNYDALLTWGAPELFNKLTEFHTASLWNISSDGSLTNDAVEEFLNIVSHKSKSRDSVKSLITGVQNFGIYGKNIPLHSAIKTHLSHGEHPHVFWRNLLEGRNPLWKFIPESTPRQRKRPIYSSDSDKESGMDGGGVKTRRRTVISTIEQGQWKPTIEGGSSGIYEGGSVPPVHNESQSSSGVPTAVINDTSLHDLLKPTVSELCSVLKFSEDVTVIVERFLKFVLEKFRVSKEHTSALHAFMISLCWVGASLAQYNIDRRESFALAAKFLNFSCSYEEADKVHKKLEQGAKDLFLQHTEILDALEECIRKPQENVEGRTISTDTLHAAEGNNEVSHNDVGSYVDSAEASTPADKYNEKNIENNNTRPYTSSHAFEDHDDLCGSKNNNRNNSLSADVSLHKTASVQPSGMPPSDNTMERVLEVENMFHQFQQPLDTGVQDKNGQTDLISLSETTTAHHESSNEDLSRKVQNEIDEFNKDWDEKRAIIENEYNVDGAITRILYKNNPSVRSEKLNMSKKKYIDKLNEHERLKEIHLKDLKAKLLPVNEELPLHVSQHEVAPSLCENPIEAQSHDEPDHDANVSIPNVTEGDDADKVESTRSHTPDKQMADASVSKEPVGEIPAQQNDDMAVADLTVLSEPVTEIPAQRHDDMTHDVAVETFLTEMEVPLVDSNKEHAHLGGNCPDRSHASGDCDETTPNDVVPDVDLQEMRMPGGSCDKENAEDRIISPDTLHAAEGNNEVSHNDVGSHVHSAEASTPADKIESASSHTPDKQTADATVPSEPVAEILAQQNDDMEIDMAVDDATVLCKLVSEVPARQLDDMMGDMAVNTDLSEMEMLLVDSNKEHASLGGNCLDRSHAREDGDKTAPNDVVPDVNSEEMGMPDGNCEQESAEDRTISADTLHAAEGNNEVSHTDVGSHVDSAQALKPADNYNEENIGDNDARPDTSSHAFEDNDDLCGSNNNNSLSADVLSDKTLLVRASPTPPSDHTMQTILEIENVSQQVQQPPDTGVQDKDGQVDLSSLAETTTGQPGEITLEDSPLDSHNEMMLPSSTYPLVLQNHSNILPPSGLFVEHSTEPTVIVSQSGESLEEHPIAAETLLGEHESNLPSSDAPPLPSPINPIDRSNFLNQVGARTPNYGDPLQVEEEQLRIENHNVTQSYEVNRQRLNSDCEKEIKEAIAQICLKYEAMQKEADAAFHAKRKELDTYLKRVLMNKILASAFRAKCQDLTPPVRFGMQQVSQPGLMQQLHRVSGPSSVRLSPVIASTSSGQASGSQQTTPPPSLPRSLPPQPPLQIVHHPEALFSSTPSRSQHCTNLRAPSTSSIRPSPNTNPPINSISTRPLANIDPTSPSTAPTRPPPIANTIPPTTPTTNRPPPVINTITPSTTPTTGRLAPGINSISPSSTPTNSRPQPFSRPNIPSSTSNRPSPGVNPVNSSSTQNRSPYIINTADMSAANLRINAETRGQNSLVRPVANDEATPRTQSMPGSEIRSGAPPMRSAVSSEFRAPAPHMRSMASSGIRAPAPHMRSFRSTSEFATQQGTPQGPHNRPLRSQSLVPSSSQQLLPSTSSMHPHPSNYIPLQRIPSSGGPSLTSTGNSNVVMDNDARFPTPPDLSQSNFMDLTNVYQEGATRSSGHDLVCLSDDE
nr:helicase protein MOM1-like isoform X2 [Erigeron canadensis]